MTGTTEAAGPTLVTYIVECFWPGVRDALVADGAERARTAAAALAVDGQPVTLTGSVLIPGDEVVFYLFEGPSLEAVHGVCQRAALPFERILESFWNRAGATREGNG